MQPIFEKLQFLVGDPAVIEEMPHCPSLGIFDERVTGFLNAVSETILKDRAMRTHPDIVSLAFWLRRKSLEELRDGYAAQLSSRLGRGVAFHVAPSNIPIQFAVTLIYGLLSGNANIVRVTEKPFEETEILCGVFAAVLERPEYRELKKYIAIVRYGHLDEVNRYFSSLCDVRIVWGGDRTIMNLRQFPLPPRALEYSFAGRDSMVVIDADAYLKGDAKVLARDFYNDTYYIDQNACSSPRIVIWTGSRVEAAKEVFWRAIAEEIGSYELSPVAGSEKLLQFCRLAAVDENIRMISADNKLVRVELDRLPDKLMDYKSNCGYFFEYTIRSLDEIVPLLTKSCQTITYFGIDPDDIRRTVLRHGVRGVDRVVPMGHAMALSLVWDGYDMIISLSRVIGSR